MTWRPELGSSSPHAVLQQQHPWLQQRKGELKRYAPHWALLFAFIHVRAVRCGAVPKNRAAPLSGARLCMLQCILLCLIIVSSGWIPFQPKQAQTTPSAGAPPTILPARRHRPRRHGVE